MDQLQVPKSTLVRGVAIAGMVGLAALVMPIVYLAFWSMLGVIGVIVAAGISAALVKAIPFLSQKWENKLLGLRIKEAQTNPIEQIQNNVLRKADQLRVFKSGLETIFSQITTLETSLKAQEKKDPEEDFTDQWGAVNKMKAFYELKKENYAQAYKALEDYKKAVERAKFKYGFGTAAQGIAAAMNANDAEALMQNMLSDESFKSIDMKFNSAFATLDLDSVELSSKKQLEFGKGITIDVQAIQIPTTQKVIA